ncbi:MAG TPA: flagellar filament capping protein FliD [Mobilitalea sp.]|nr:flagellar filament capping protein FliD [Mobilitalea sp.]
MSTSSSASSSSTIRMSGLASGMDTESIVTGLMKAQRLKEQKLKNKQTTTEWKKEIWKGLNTKIYSFYTGALSKLKMQGSYNTKKVTSSDENNATVTLSSNASAGTQTLKISQLAKAQSVTGAALGSGVTASTKLTSLGFASSGDSISVAVGSKTVQLDITDTTTVSSVVDKLKTAGLNANYDSTQKRFFISSMNSGTANSFSLSSTNTAGLAALGLNTIDTSSGTPVASGSAAMTLIAPTDANFEYNGAAMTSSSNTVSVNGLTITLKAVTDGSGTVTTADDEVINLNVTNDTQATYDNIKSFVKEYNSILSQLYTYYDADTAKGYEPLTDDQKSSMSDTEIEKWETKIKDSLLRRDDNLNGIINTMRNTMSGSIKVDGKSYSLASFGIGSVNYTEKGNLHIDGDSDDSLVSGLTNDLKNALSSNPDTVAQVLSGLATNLYTSFTNSMKSSSLRSALTMYNDKELTKQITDYKSQIKDFESKLTDMENRYYKQFSAMETALAKMNSQSSSLSSMLGTSN